MDVSGISCEIKNKIPFNKKTDTDDVGLFISISAVFFNIYLTILAALKRA